MRRLMELLAAPLGRWEALSQPSYAEWVGARARVALLQAHAQCASIGRSAGGDGLTAAIVAEAQKPHRDMLLVLWRALLQDYAVLATQPPAVAAAHASLLLGDAAAGGGAGGCGAAVLPQLAAAAPAALEALSRHLPRAADIAGARDAFLKMHGGAAAAAAAALLSGGPGAMAPSAVAATASALARWDDFAAAMPSPPPADAAAGAGPGSAAAAAAAAAAGGAGGDSAESRSAVARWARANAAAAATASAQKAYGEFVRTRAWHMYRSTLDLGLALLARLTAAAALPAAARATADDGAAGLGPAVARCGSALRALQRLTAGPLLAAGLCDAGVLAEVQRAAVGLLVRVLSPLQRRALRAGAPPGCAAEAGALLRRCAEGLRDAGAAAGPEAFAAHPALTTALLDGVLAASSLAAPFVSVRGAPAPAPGPVAAAAAAAGEPALLAALIAAQHALRKAPPEAGAFVASPMLGMGTRLLAAGPPGLALAAAGRYLEGAAAAAAERARDAAAPAPVRAALLADLAAAPLRLADAAAAALRGWPADGDAGGDAGPRLAALLGAMLSCAALAAGAAAAAHDKEAVAHTGAVRAECLRLLSGALDPAAPVAVTAAALSAARAFLQEAAAEASAAAAAGGRAAAAAGPRSRLAADLVPAVGPVVATLAHELMRGGPPGAPLAPDAAAAVGEALKALLLAATWAGAAAGEGAQGAALGVLLPLLIEAAAPAPGSAPPTPALVELAVSLVSALPSSPAGAAFRGVLAALPASLKARLQAALRAGAGAGAGGSAGGAASAAAAAAARKAPTIQLKTSFAIAGGA